MAFLPLEGSDHVVVSVSIDFFSNLNGDATFHRTAYDYTCADWKDLLDLLRNVPWEDNFKLVAFAARFKFCVWFQVGIDVSIQHRKFQVKPHLSPWFSAASAVVIAQRYPFFQMYQQNKSSASNSKFRQVSRSYKNVLKAAKFACANKTKKVITSQKRGSRDFWQIANSVLTEINLLYLLYLTDRGLFAAFDKAKLFAKDFSKYSNLDGSGISLIFI